MNSIPLIKGNTPQEINTSIIALKKALDNLQATNSEDLQKRIDEINAQIETLNQHLNIIDGQITDLQPVDSVTSGDMHSVTSNAVNGAIEDITKNTINKGLSQAGWYKIGSCAYYNYGSALKIFLTSVYNYIPCASHSIDVAYGWVNPKISETCYDNYSVFDKLMITYESNNYCNIFVHYNRNDFNTCGLKIIGSSWGSLQTFNFEPADISGFTNYAIFNLGTNGFYADGVSINEFNPQIHYLAPNTSIEINLAGITMYRISAWFYGGIYYLGGGVNNLFGPNKNINIVYKVGDALGFAVTDNKVTVVNNIADAFHISIEKIL